MKEQAYIHLDSSEEKLLSDLLHNDQDSFSRIYDIYAARLYGMILKWVKEKEKAVILLHDAFVKAWESRKLFDSKIENLFFWLCRLARICYNEKTVTGF